jgi:molybdenum ABC transporter molybdate-binding protein
MRERTSAVSDTLARVSVRAARRGSRMRVRSRWRAALCAPLALLAACSSGDSSAGESGSPVRADSPAHPLESDTIAPLLVLAASDLQQALPRIVELYQRKTGVRVQVSFGSTGNLTTQIENGAPADLFLAASETFIDRLEKGGHIRTATRRVYAQGLLAVTWREGAPEVDSLPMLAGDAYRTIAIANPEHAPYGQLAEEALRNWDLLDEVRPKIVYAENVSQALQMVATGNADAGLVALAGATGSGSARFAEVYTRPRVGEDGRR